MCKEGWFSDHVSRSVENGKHTLFCSDVLVGGVSFKDRFSRLFDMSLFKGVSVFDMCQLGWGEDGGAWKWWRRLFTWEGELVGELSLLLPNVILQVEKDDRWHWNLESTHAFSVRSAYKFLSNHHHVAATVAKKSLCHKDISLKVVFFVWCLFRDRLPTKDNLLHHGVIDNDSQLCVWWLGFFGNFLTFISTLLLFWASLALYSLLAWRLFSTPCLCCGSV